MFLKSRLHHGCCDAKAYGYRRGDNYVYVNREARMGRTALVIHPALKERSNSLAEPASEIKTCDHYEQFPLYLAGMRSNITVFPTVLVRGWRLSVF